MYYSLPVNMQFGGISIGDELSHSGLSCIYYRLGLLGYPFCVVDLEGALLYCLQCLFLLILYEGAKVNFPLYLHFQREGL